MHEIDISQTDLNLLVVLDVLLQERSVSRAAKRLHRTQSAISHALARLREQLDDPVLVRVGNDMRPSPRAEELAPEISRILGLITRVLSQRSAFELATITRVFRVAAPDFVTAAWPHLIDLMHKQAPDASVELMPVRGDVARDVVDGRYDILVAPPRKRADDGLASETIATLEWAVYARESHPAIARWGRRAWSRYPHVRVRTSGPNASGAPPLGPVDHAANSAQIKRKLGPILPHFSLAPALLAKTDLLMTVPRAIFADIGPGLGLVALPCPIKLAPMVLAIHWSAMLDRDPALAWFRNTCRQALQATFAQD